MFPPLLGFFLPSFKSRNVTNEDAHSYAEEEEQRSRATRASSESVGGRNKYLGAAGGVASQGEAMHDAMSRLRGDGGAARSRRFREEMMRDLPSLRAGQIARQAAGCRGAGGGCRELEMLESKISAAMAARE